MGEGVRSWMRICPYCGKHYRLTNFMRRPGWDYKAGEYENTHLIACRRRVYQDGIKCSEAEH